ncbi:MAG: restriction endonuclease subunit M, partial [Chloroflexi bacterium]|nr:restriction endonuclease subunit M [Chloroflexota bacterium]
IYQITGGEWRLTLAEKKRILLNNIYGVDIDPQAVEVTKLSLLLKVLEGETEATLQPELLPERALPDLAHNIKCGNSLLDPSFFETAQPGLFDTEEWYRINPFDWEEEFPEVFEARGQESGIRGRGSAEPCSLTPDPSSRGFDAVVGNPPYIRIQTMKEWAPKEVAFYKQRYVAASKGNYDIYVVFVERGLSLLNERGRLGFILPHKFFNAQYGQPLRGLLAEGAHLAEVVHFGDQQVFEGATTYTCLMFLNKAGSDGCTVQKVSDLPAWLSERQAVAGKVPAKRITEAEWNFGVGPGADLFHRLSEMPVKLGDVARLFVGLQTNADDVFIVEQIRSSGDRVLCLSNATGNEHWLEEGHLKFFLKGSLNIRRYHLSDVNKRLIFPYKVEAGRATLIPEVEYREQYPLTWDYLHYNQPRLATSVKREMGKAWYGYVYEKNHARLATPKLLVPSLARRACFAPDLEGRYYFVGSGGGGGGGYGISLNENQTLHPLYLLGVLNSAAQSFYLRLISTPYRGGYIALNRQYIEQLPIRTIDFTSPADVARHDRMVALVERMLALHKELAAARTPHDKTLLQRQIEATDRQIDALVYELYDLTAEEIAIVEGKKQVSSVR